jgi:hypothetical protein
MDGPVIGQETYSAFCIESISTFWKDAVLILKISIEIRVVGSESITTDILAVRTFISVNYSWKTK